MWLLLEIACCLALFETTWQRVVCCLGKRGSCSFLLGWCSFCLCSFVKWCGVRQRRWVQNRHASNMPHTLLWVKSCIHAQQAYTETQKNPHTIQAFFLSRDTTSVLSQATWFDSQLHKDRFAVHCYIPFFRDFFTIPHQISIKSPKWEQWPSRGRYQVW